MSDIIENQKFLIKMAATRLEESYIDLDAAIWNGHELGMNITDLAKASGRSRQTIYTTLEREAKRRDTETRHKRIREWVREYKGMEVPETGSISASIIEDFDNWEKRKGNQ